MPDTNLTIEHIERKYQFYQVELSPGEALAEVMQYFGPMTGGEAALEAWEKWREQRSDNLHREG